MRREAWSWLLMLMRRKCEELVRGSRKCEAIVKGCCVLYKQVQEEISSMYDYIGAYNLKK
jgi:hypothetical protein